MGNEGRVVYRGYVLRFAVAIKYAPRTSVQNLGDKAESLEGTGPLSMTPERARPPNRSLFSGLQLSCKAAQVSPGQSALRLYG